MATLSMNNDPLDQLKPIVLPDHGASVWPLAPGWWFIISLVLLGALLVFFLRPLLKNRRYRKEVQSNTLNLLQLCHDECLQLDDKGLATQLYLQKSNDIFKRMVHADPMLATYSGLTGQSWINFILKVDPDKNFASLYGDNLYAARCNEKVELEKLHTWACHWAITFSRCAKKIARSSKI